MKILNTDRLPIRNRGGIWQLRKQFNRKRISVSLGTGNRELALERANRLVSSFAGSTFTESWVREVESAVRGPRGWIYKHWNKTLRRRPNSTLTLEDLKQVALRSGGTCEVSGLRFVIVSDLHPFQPSLDRIDNTRGYTLDNVRLVCLVVNYCMNRWGDKIFSQLAISMARRYLQDLEQSMSVGPYVGQSKNQKNT